MKAIQENLVNGLVDGGHTLKAMFLKLDLQFFAAKVELIKNYEMLKEAIQQGRYEGTTFSGELAEIINLIDLADNNETHENIEKIESFFRVDQFPENIVLILKKKIRVLSNRLTRSSEVNLGEVVSVIRKQRGVTLKSIEEATGITSSYLSRLEANVSKSVPSVTIIKLLSETLQHDFFQYYKPQIKTKKNAKKSIGEVLHEGNFYIDDESEEYSYTEKELLSEIMQEIVKNDFEGNQMFELAVLMEKIKRFKGSQK